MRGTGRSAPSLSHFLLTYEPSLLDEDDVKAPESGFAADKVARVRGGPEAEVRRPTGWALSAVDELMADTKFSGATFCDARRPRTTPTDGGRGLHLRRVRGVHHLFPLPFEVDVDDDLRPSLDSWRLWPHSVRCSAGRFEGHATLDLKL